MQKVVKSCTPDDFLRNNIPSSAGAQTSFYVSCPESGNKKNSLDIVRFYLIQSENDTCKLPFVLRILESIAFRISHNKFRSKIHFLNTLKLLSIHHTAARTTLILAGFLKHRTARERQREFP